MVTVELADHYFGEFGDPEDELDYVSYKIFDAGRWTHCWAYVEKDSEVNTLLADKMRRERAFLSRTGRWVPEAQKAPLPSPDEEGPDGSQSPDSVDRSLPPVKVTLKLRFTPQSQGTNQVLIDEIVSESWVKP
jgi:hypothetical protein